MPEAPKTLTVRKSSRRQNTGGTELTIWDAVQLNSSTVPLEQGMSALLKNGASSILFLKADKQSFSANACVASKMKIGFWTGLKLTQATLESHWPSLIKANYVELAANESHRTIRNAFAVEATETLTFILAGPANSPKGLLAITSTTSLAAMINQVLPLINA
jgi:hypothetical protein